MKNLKRIGLLIILTCLFFVISSMPAMAATYADMNAMKQAIRLGTAQQYQTVTFHGYEWIYMGQNTNTSDTIMGDREYFIMTKNSFQTMNIKRVYSGIYAWLNGTFKQNYLGNDSQIYEVTLVTLNDYNSYIKSYGEGTYNDNWCLYSQTEYGFNVVFTNGGTLEFGPIDIGVNGSYAVRPVISLKPDPNPPTITFDKVEGSYSGNVSVNILCDSMNCLSKSQYQWTTDPAKPQTGWTNFQLPYRTQLATQSIAAVWYLHVVSTDIYEQESYTRKMYTVTATPTGGWITEQDKRDIANAVVSTDAITGIKASSASAATQSTTAAIQATTAATQSTTAAIQATTAVNNTTYNGQSSAYWAYQSYLLAQKAYDVANEARNALRKKAIKVINGVIFKEVVYGELSNPSNTNAKIESAADGYTVIKGNLIGEGIQIIYFDEKGTTEKRGIIFNVVAAPSLVTTATVNFIE